MTGGAVIQGSFPRGVRVAAQGWRTSGRAATERRETVIGSAFVLPQHLACITDTGGQPLPIAVRQTMESFFGTSFADVRVHVGPHPVKIGADAFTRGPHIHFAPGRYDPSSVHGRRLLGHELAHVVQQRARRVHNPFGAGAAVVVHDDRLEAEADRLAARASAFRPAATQRPMPQRPLPRPLQRKVLQRRWVGHAPGDPYSMIRWRQTSEDTANRVGLADGWYKAKPDLRTYWTIKLSSAEVIAFAEDYIVRHIKQLPMMTASVELQSYKSEGVSEKAVVDAAEGTTMLSIAMFNYLSRNAVTIAAFVDYALALLDEQTASEREALLTVLSELESRIQRTFWGGDQDREKIVEGKGTMVALLREGKLVLKQKTANIPPEALPKFLTTWSTGLEAKSYVRRVAALKALSSATAEEGLPITKVQYTTNVYKTADYQLLDKEGDVVPWEKLKPDTDYQLFIKNSLLEPPTVRVTANSGSSIIVTEVHRK